MEELIAKLKVIEDNIKTLHHNLVGPNWFGDHVLLGDYYDKVSEIEDAVIEMNIMNGGKDLNIKECLEKYPALEVREFTNDEAFKICLKYFLDLIEAIENAKKEVPDDCVSELETFQYWFRLEGKYKIAHRLAEKN